MRRYETRTIAATIRQKPSSVSKNYGIKARPLTAEDFEIVPEHNEEYLVAAYCDICGLEAEWVDSETTEAQDGRTSLVELNMRYCPTREDDWESAEDVFWEDWLPEVCTACLRNTITPYLKSLRHPDAVVEPEESAVVPETSMALLPRPPSRGPLIGEEEESWAIPPLPPLSADEPF